MPASLSAEDAATVLFKGITAHYLLHTTARAGPGTVIVLYRIAGSAAPDAGTASGSVRGQDARPVAARILDAQHGDDIVEHAVREPAPYEIAVVQQTHEHVDLLLVAW